MERGKGGDRGGGGEREVCSGRAGSFRCRIASGSLSSTAGHDCTGGPWSLCGLYPCCVESNRVCLFFPLFSCVTTRVHEPLEDRVMNSVRFTGPFSLSQCHEWADSLLEGVPPKWVS